LAYLSTRNYSEAVESLEKIKNKDATIKAAIQKTAYYRGLELFQNLNFEEAIKMFDLSLQHSNYNQILPRSHLLASRIVYRVEITQKRPRVYKIFLTPGAFNYQSSTWHTLTLVFPFIMKNYDEAIVWFRKFTSISNDEKNFMLAMLYNRIGDSFFINAVNGLPLIT
jgi:tetratricopeptide (TPR) repeat protein